MRKILMLSLFSLLTFAAYSQGLKKVYDENINQIEQINNAVNEAKATGKYVICQLGGNWCPWCLKFADFITNDSTINNIVEKNFVYIHVNYNPKKTSDEKAESLAQATLQRLGNPQRFGFPVFVILDEKGNIIHTQDSVFLEEGKGYDRKKVLRFFENWTPNAVKASIKK